MGAVLSLAGLPDIPLHILVTFHDLPLIHLEDVLNEGGACPPAVHSGLLVHEGGVLFVVERPPVNLQDAGADAGLGGLCAERFLSRGQGHGSPLVDSLDAAALGSPDLAGAAGDHVDDFLQRPLVIPGQLPFVDAQREVAVKCRRPLQAHLGGVKVDHEPLWVSPGGESCFQGCGLAALGAAPVVNKKYSLLHDPQERGGEAGGKDEAELLTAPVGGHVFDPPLHGAVLAVRCGHASLGWVNIQGDPLIVAGDKPPPWLPAEGGGGVVFGDDVDVLRLQSAQELYHVLRVLAGDGAAQVRQGGDAPAGENHRPGINGPLPLSVSLEGNLHLFVSGLQAFQALGQEDGCAADIGGCMGLWVDPADALIRKDPALRRPQAEGCAGDGFLTHLCLQVDCLCPFQGLPDQLGCFLFAVGQVNVGRVFFAETLAAPDVNLPGESGVCQGVCELPVEGVASAIRLFVDVELQVLQAYGLVVLEHGGSGDANGGDAKIPEGLGVALPLNEDGVSGFPDSRQSPFPVEAYLALAAPHPAELLFRVPLPNGGFFAVLEKVGHPQVFGAVPVSPGVYPAGVPEEVCREALVEAVPFQGVGAEAAGVG